MTSYKWQPANCSQSASTGLLYCLLTASQLLKLRALGSVTCSATVSFLPIYGRNLRLGMARCNSICFTHDNKKEADVEPSTERGSNTRPLCPCGRKHTHTHTHTPYIVRPNWLDSVTDTGQINKSLWCSIWTVRTVLMYSTVLRHCSLFTFD